MILKPIFWYHLMMRAGISSMIFLYMLSHSLSFSPRGTIEDTPHNPHHAPIGHQWLHPNCNSHCGPPSNLWGCSCTCGSTLCGTEYGECIVLSILGSYLIYIQAVEKNMTAEIENNGFEPSSCMRLGKRTLYLDWMMLVWGAPGEFLHILGTTSDDEANHTQEVNKAFFVDFCQGCIPVPWMERRYQS